jgi:hypothetical protein
MGRKREGERKRWRERQREREREMNLFLASVTLNCWCLICRYPITAINWASLKRLEIFNFTVLRTVKNHHFRNSFWLALTLLTWAQALEAWSQSLPRKSRWAAVDGPCRGLTATGECQRLATKQCLHAYSSLAIWAVHRRWLDQGCMFSSWTVEGTVPRHVEISEVYTCELYSCYRQTLVHGNGKPVPFVTGL